jgi:ABC-type transport system involved in multi-copper enzyme maturation permease subunit
VNATLVVAFLRQRLTSPIRIVLLLAVFTLPLFIVALTPGTGLAPLGGAAQFALIFAVGLIGQDYSSGVLQLLFARPVTRAEYVTSRWIAAAGAAALLGVAQIALGAVVLALRGHPVTLAQAGLVASNSALEAIGVTAVITLFSSLVSGITDLGIYVVAVFLAQMFQLFGRGLKAVAFLLPVGAELERFIGAKLDVMQFHDLATVSWFAVASYLSTVTLCLALAILVVNRKELSYATG